MVAAHGRIGIVVGILVDEFDDHVVVSAGGGGEDVGDRALQARRGLLEGGDQRWPRVTVRLQLRVVARVHACAGDPLLKARADRAIELDPKKRDDLYRQAATILNIETPVAFCWYNVATTLISPRVQGLKVDPFEYFVGQHSLYEMKLTS